MAEVRKVSSSDLPGIEAVEVSRYRRRYSELPEKRAEYREYMKKRFEVASEWMWVAVEDDIVVGSVSAQPTSKSPYDFISWEESTDDGALSATFEETGENLYVVNLDVAPGDTSKESQNLLMVSLALEGIRQNKNLVYFESRMPSFRSWMRNHHGETLQNWQNLSDEEQMEFAVKYARLTEDGGCNSSDPLLRFYSQTGFKALKVSSDAFVDPESLNFGVVFQAENPLPKPLRVYGLRHLVYLIAKATARNPKVLEWLVP